MHFNIISLPMFVSAVLMFLIAVRVKKYWHSKGVFEFSLAMISGSIYSLFYGLEISASNEHLGYIFYVLQYIGIPFLTVFTFVFALNFSGAMKRNASIIQKISLSIAISILLIVLTNHYHYSFIRDYHFLIDSLYNASSFTPVWGYWVQQVYSILLMIATFFLFMRMWFGSSGQLRKQVALILMTAFVPFVIYLLYLFKWFTEGIDPIPISFLFTGFIIYLGIERYHIFKIHPIARNVLFDSIPDFVIVLSKEELLLDYNVSAKKMFNLSNSHIGRQLSDEHVLLRDMFRLNMENQCDELIHSNISNNGNMFYLTSTCSVLFDSNNEIRGYMLIVRDVTIEKQNEKLKKEAEEKFRLIVEHAPLGFFSFDTNGVINFCNDVFGEIIGTAKEQLIGLNMLLVPDKKVVEGIQSVIIGNTKSFEGDYTTFTSGKTVQVRVVASTLYNVENNIIGGIGIVEDISERKEAEDKNKKNTAQLEMLVSEKDKLFSIIAHDLRSPFTSILGFARLMSDKSNSFSLENMQQYAEILKTSSESYFYLLENLLEWSRLQQGMVTPSIVPIDIVQVVEHIISLYSEEVKKKHINVNREIPQKLHVLADEAMLNSIMRNLISNAIKFTQKEGYLQIEIKEIDNNSVQICVKDNGVGMDSSQLDMLFSFAENKSSYGTEGEKGTGLGLIICNEFIEQLGSSLQVESEIGRGSCFKFSLKKI
jgi:PAS domain S-box-containing protein